MAVKGWPISTGHFSGNATDSVNDVWPALYYALFLDFTNTLDDLEPKAFIKTNASFQIPARDTHTY